MFRDTDGHWHTCVTVDNLKDIPDCTPGEGYPLIYISGPYSTGDSVQHMRRAIMAAEVLREKGYTPIVPHLSLIWHAVVPHEWQWWLDYDIDILKRCDLLVRLSGDSPGAETELDYWLSSVWHRPVIYTEEEYD